MVDQLLSALSDIREMINYVKKYMNKHIGDKTIKEKILEETENVPKPADLDFYIKEVIDEQFTNARVIRTDNYLVNIQKAIKNILGPVCHMWHSAAIERKALQEQKRL